MRRVWILLFCYTLVTLPAALALAPAAPAQTASADEAQQHGFDFEAGPTWTADLRLLAHRFVGSHQWLDFHGTLKINELWHGRGNMSELDVSDGSARIVGGALHLYNPQTRQWSLWFADADGGTLGAPGVGRFDNGKGVFYDHEMYHGRMIYVRQAFSNMSAHAFNYEQAFSLDNGKTWETNLIIKYTR